MKRVNVGYIGWLSYDDTEFSKPHAICDVNRQKLDEYKHKHPDVKIYTDYRRMAEDPELDVVIISTPNWLHCEMSELFLMKGKHVFCEKPMGINKHEMDRMLMAERKSGKKLALDFEMRSSEGTKRAKAIIDSGELGTVKGFEFVHHRGAWQAEGAMLWRIDPAKSGGLFFMEVCHEVDFMRWIMGEITHVQSFKIPNIMPQYYKDMPDNVFSHFFFASGAIGHISTHHALSVFTAKEEEYDKKGHDMFFVLYGDQGSLRLDCIKKEMLIVKHREYPKGTHGRRTEFDRIEDLSGHDVLHDIEANRTAFIKACAFDRPHVQDGYDAWRTHVVCLAAEKSELENFQKIKIAYDEP